jgi:hypothetical protein
MGELQNGGEGLLLQHQFPLLLHSYIYKKEAVGTTSFSMVSFIERAVSDIINRY